MTTTRKNYLYLILIIFIWAMNWPVMKLGMQYLPPLWFATIRLFLASLIMFGVVIYQRQFIFPKVKDLPMIVSIGILQLGLFMILVNYGLTYVDPGRSAILSYSTPIWVTPLAILFFAEKTSPLKMLGLLLGLAGILILFNPYTFDWSNRHVLMGNGALLLSAICWAIAMLHTRYGKWYNSATALFPWQLLLGGLFCLPLALTFNSVSAIHWTPQMAWIIIYTTLLSTAFGFWAAITISKSLSVVITSLSLLLVPVLGLVFSALIIGERITAGILLAMLLIVGGLTCVSLANRIRTPFSPK